MHALTALRTMQVPVAHQLLRQTAHIAVTSFATALLLHGHAGETKNRIHLLALSQAAGAVSRMDEQALPARLPSTTTLAYEATSVRPEPPQWRLVSWWRQRRWPAFDFRPHGAASKKARRTGGGRSVPRATGAGDDGALGVREVAGARKNFCLAVATVRCCVVAIQKRQG